MAQDEGKHGTEGHSDVQHSTRSGGLGDGELDKLAALHTVSRLQGWESL